MKLLTLLHFYQPFDQQEDILNRIVHECYLPLTRGLLNVPRARVVVNISGALTELLINRGYQEVIDNFNLLYSRGQIEYTSSSKYHAFLPLLPSAEIDRQIMLNNEINSKYLKGFAPDGFFSPEMSVSPHILNAVARNKFKWIAAPHLSCASSFPGPTKIYVDENTGLNILFRNKRVSSLMLSSMCRTADDLIKETTDLHESDKYWVTVMDAETFGHHRIGHEKFLFDVLSHSFIEPVLSHDLFNALSLEKSSVKMSSATWTNEEQDFWLDKDPKHRTDAKSFILWNDPDNPIHALQWKLLNLVLSTLTVYKNKNSAQYVQAREDLDKALASDPFWWASAKPWWSLEMIEQGAYRLKSVLINLDPEMQSTKDAENLYRNILDLAFDWQRTGYIRKRHLENSSTYMKEPLYKRTHAEWFNQLVLEFEDELNKSAARKDFEKAIKWRDALIKIKSGTDIYDILHVVDELWTARTIPSVKPFFAHSWEEFSDYAKSIFLNVPDKEAFERWKGLTK